MLKHLTRQLDRRRLRDDRFSHLFEPYCGNEAVCFDLETTGLDASNCEILSIGAVKIRDHRILASQKLELIVQPTGQIDQEAIKTHHLRHLDVAGGMEPKLALARLLEFIGPRPLVGYYLEFDVAVVNRYLRPWLGIRLPNHRMEVSELYYDWVTRGRPAGHVDLRFDTLLEVLDLPALPKHSAINDALMTALMYIKLRNPNIERSKQNAASALIRS